MRDTIAVILAGGRGERLSVLSAKRAKPAVPFAGKFRIIDFTLSNCVNSGIYHVAVLTQYRPHSLNDHIGIGKPWDLDRMKGGVRLLQPYIGRNGAGWYRGTADAVYQNLPFLADWRWEQALVLSGDHIYKMNYTHMLAFHEERRADVTVAVMEVPIEEASRFGTMVIDSSRRVVSFEEKPPRPRSNLISMGVYVFNKETLYRHLEQDAKDTTSTHDFGRDILPRMVLEDRVYAYPFHGYWRDVGTIHTYWEANMGLLKDPPDIDLYDPEWVIHTRSEERAAARITRRGRVVQSLISHGCIVDGTVEHSVLSPGVFVAEGAVVRDSVLFTDCIIGMGSILDKVIVDKGTVIGAHCVLGEGDDLTPNRNEPSNLYTGITVVGKRARVPPGARLGRNVKVEPDVQEADFDRLHVPSGETVHARQPESVVAWVAAEHE